MSNPANPGMCSQCELCQTVVIKIDPHDLPITWPAGVTPPGRGVFLKCDLANPWDLMSNKFSRCNITPVRFVKRIGPSLTEPVLIINANNMDPAAAEELALRASNDKQAVAHNIRMGRKHWMQAYD